MTDSDLKRICFLCLFIVTAIALAALLAGCGQKQKPATLAEWEHREAVRKEGFDAGVKWLAQSGNVYLAPLVITNDNVTVSNCVFIKLESGMIEIRNSSNVIIAGSTMGLSGLSGVIVDTPKKQSYANMDSMEIAYRAGAMMASVLIWTNAPDKFETAGDVARAAWKAAGITNAP